MLQRQRPSEYCLASFHCFTSRSQRAAWPRQPEFIAIRAGRTSSDPFETSYRSQLAKTSKVNQSSRLVGEMSATTASVALA